MAWEERHKSEGKNKASLTCKVKKTTYLETRPQTLRRAKNPSIRPLAEQEGPEGEEKAAEVEDADPFRSAGRKRRRLSLIFLSARLRTSSFVIRI